MCILLSVTVTGIMLYLVIVTLFRTCVGSLPGYYARTKSGNSQNQECSRVSSLTSDCLVLRNYNSTTMGSNDTTILRPNPRYDFFNHRDPTASSTISVARDAIHAVRATLPHTCISSVSKNAT
eukprot:1781584-Rhodomonas_salina.1